MKAVTKVILDDIAKRAGISKAAVSEILRNHPNAKRFRKETREKVHLIAQEMNYKPNFFTSQIRRKNRKLIMLCLHRLSDPYVSCIAETFEHVLAGRGYNLLVSPSANRRDVEFYENVLGQHGIMGLVVVGSSTMRGLDVQTDKCLAEVCSCLGWDVVGIAARRIDRDKRMMPMRRSAKAESQIEQRMSVESVIGMVKP